MAERKGEIFRKTNETSVAVRVDIDGTGKSIISTGVGFFDHMLDQLSRHSLIDMDIDVKGDLHIDNHHTVEDAGIAIGQAIAKALGRPTQHYPLRLARSCHGRDDDQGRRRYFRPPLPCLDTLTFPHLRSVASIPIWYANSFRCWHKTPVLRCIS